jgi:ABC-type glutathione transport system ATPase component
MARCISIRKSRRRAFERRAAEQGSLRSNVGRIGVETAALALEMRNITNSFPGVQALDDLTFGCARGEVHALCGENGAGKSTLIKILGGAYQPDAGRIRIDGREVAFSHPIAARKAGISIIHQELSLLPYRTVAENIFLGVEPTRCGARTGSTSSAPNSPRATTRRRRRSSTTTISTRSGWTPARRRSRRSRPSRTRASPIRSSPAKARRTS